MLITDEVENTLEFKINIYTDILSTKKQYP